MAPLGKHKTVPRRHCYLEPLCLEQALDPQILSHVQLSPVTYSHPTQPLADTGVTDKNRPTGGKEKGHYPLHIGEENAGSVAACAEVAW